MNELVNQITQRTGISQQQAMEAIQTVIGFVKDKLPAPIASQLEAALSGQGGGSGGNMMGQAQQALGGLGGMLGGNQGNQTNP